MKKKIMIKMWQKCLFKTKINTFNCEYILVKSEADNGSKYITYGIKINKCDRYGNLLETKKVQDIGADKDKVIQIIKLLKDFKVTPVTLEDVIMDRINI